LATVDFYGLNCIDIDTPDDDAYDLVIAVASGG
jgi:death-on-curing protein